MTRQELTAYMESILPADRESMDAARRRQAELAKPPGSLGALEDMSGWRGSCGRPGRRSGGAG